MEGTYAARLVGRLVDEVVNEGRLDVLGDLYVPQRAAAARAWVAAFLAAFSGVRMRVVETVEQGDRIMARFVCSGTHTGPWLGHPPTGRRFVGVEEVYVFHLRDGRIAGAWGLEDTYGRLRQLGLLRDEAS